MNNIGVQGYTIRDYMSSKEQFTETLIKLRKIGYTCLDHGIPQGMTAVEFKEMLHETDILPIKVGTDLYTLLENPAQSIQDAHGLGVDLVMVVSIPKNMRGSESDFHQYAADLNRAGNLLKKEGLRLAYHTHAFEFCSFGGYNGMDIMINETDCVEFVPDTHWVAAGGLNPPDFIRRLQGRCTQIHCKDYGIDTGTEIVENVPRIYAEVGQGNLNWPEIVRACKETGIRTFLVEQDFCKVDPFTSLTTSFHALKRLGV